MKLHPSKYRGVVAQRSGKWGAQIYINNERVWLGTFRTQVEAARTYDIGAQCLHESHAVTNFNSLSKSDNDTKAELHFLKSRTKADIVSMLRRHTYREEFKRCRYMDQTPHLQCNEKEKTQELLFYKVVSPGDIGPQNRLLIPRQHAEKHFSICGSSNDTHCKGVMINFEDGAGKIWRFRYAYWSSSRNHVLNGGWAQFAREKGLRPGDSVRFWRVTGERDYMQFFIQCDTRRAVAVKSEALVLPIEQPDKKIRLFGFNIPVSTHH